MFTENSFPSNEELTHRFGSRVRFNEPLAPHVAYNVGGKADILICPETEDELAWLQSLKNSTGAPITIIGRGTNLLVTDLGIRGITVMLRSGFSSIVIDSQTSAGTWVRVEGGVDKAALLEWAIENNLSGLEFSAGVPGTIGGGIFMNAGTKYGCYGDILKKLRLFSFDEGFKDISREAANFSYRHQNAVRGSLVISATFELKKGTAIEMRQRVDSIIKERCEKQPLDFPSCGSTFKNPEGHSAGRLIEKAGLKGLRVGGAEISLKHANFILNRGSATASDILELIRIAKESVLAQFGVTLECEVIIVGDTPGDQGPKQT